MVYNIIQLSKSQALVAFPAAYRFFKNDNVKESKILESHIAKTVERIKEHDKVLVIQDTSYITYTSHKKTTGLGVLSIGLWTKIPVFSQNRKFDKKLVF